MDPPEFESVHSRKFIDNMQIYRSFLEDLNSGKFYTRFTMTQKGQMVQQEILKKTYEISLDHSKRTDESISQVTDLVQKVSLQFYSSLNDQKSTIESMTRTKLGVLDVLELVPA